MVFLQGRGPRSGAVGKAEESLHTMGAPSIRAMARFISCYRSTAQDSHKQVGAGLGLSISKRIASLYGGTIAAQNLPGSGLQVQLNLSASQQIAA